MESCVWVTRVNTVSLTAEVCETNREPIWRKASAKRVDAVLRGWTKRGIKTETDGNVIAMVDWDICGYSKCDKVAPDGGYCSDTCRDGHAEAQYERLIENHWG